MMQRLGLDMTVIDCRWGDGADEARWAGAGGQTAADQGG